MNGQMIMTFKLHLLEIVAMSKFKLKYKSYMTQKWGTIWVDTKKECLSLMKFYIQKSNINENRLKIVKINTTFHGGSK